MQIDIVNDHGGWREDDARIRRAVGLVLDAAGITAGAISVAIVDDATIHRLNAQFLQHDEATDVLSFVLERRPGYLEGEVVASGDTAARTAARMGWPADDELLLYVVHGVLHLVGYDDLDEGPRQAMRRRETEVLAQLGLTAPGPAP